MIIIFITIFFIFTSIIITYFIIFIFIKFYSTFGEISIRSLSYLLDCKQFLQANLNHSIFLICRV